jgi:hypothetical protein
MNKPHHVMHIAHYFEWRVLECVRLKRRFGYRHWSMMYAHYLCLAQGGY